ncbi:hypothetical protein Q604_UNBC12937G0001, partial [human gut metagenome]
IYTLIKGSIFNIEPFIFASYSFVLDYASIGLAYFFSVRMRCFRSSHFKNFAEVTRSVISQGFTDLIDG